MLLLFSFFLYPFTSLELFSFLSVVAHDECSGC